MTADELLALLTLATAMSFTPGPNTTMAASLGANLGWRAAMRFVLGVPVGWTLLMLACGLGLGALVMALPAVRIATQALGLAYMLWLAWKLWGSGALNKASNTGLDIGFTQGVLLQFVNIKAWMLALAMTSGWITVPGLTADMLTQRLLIVCGVMMVFALTSNLLYALTGSLLRAWLGQGGRLLVFNRCMASLLCLTALWMLRL
ncbi:LysE family translocator [Roseateles toxinivorans]|uniref:Threonine/homoserine/homoserine lactone efflux protein n=1 Tax=Roseateles toxinivorans TaxID=270368 RepID=A0A4V3CSX9_9BURK|nr:LysE family translocator [Roseateles toxinivorans]TDP62557.1 threonine/homoserine/homoserine lactone efflux protein [Roseateles toxinivorans]